jgi:putative ABC transport system substrate-binding protein
MLGSAAMAGPLAARAQQVERMRRIGVVTNFAADDPATQPRLAAFLQGLQQLGWTEGRNIRIDIRWSTGDAERARRYVAELVALACDVILTVGSPTTGLLLQATRSLPIVFVQVADPVGAGFVASLAQPGGNATGFTIYEYGIGAKWLELLKEIAPRVTRAGILRDSANVAEIAMFGAIQSAAPLLGMELSPISLSDAGEIERGIAAFAREPNRGLIVVSASTAIFHRGSIITMAARHQLPTVYPDYAFVSGGGLISYGPDRLDQYLRAAGYVDRILKGEKPADLPVQAPTKYQLAINLKTAKTLGLDLPTTVLARANEVIE